VLWWSLVSDLYRDFEDALYAALNGLLSRKRGGVSMADVGRAVGLGRSAISTRFSERNLSLDMVITTLRLCGEPPARFFVRVAGVDDAKADTLPDMVAEPAGNGERLLMLEVLVRRLEERLLRIEEQGRGDEPRRRLA
jgi:hypothetical protein